MFVDYTEAQKNLRRELRGYFSNLMTPEIREEIRGKETGELYNSLVRQIGQDGWLAIGWPKEYGGQGRNTAEQMIFFEEALLVDAPLPFITLNTVGPALMEHGSEQHKEQFLPGIAGGEILFAVAYTEPSAGTDLASLETSAVKEGDHWVINGTKVFTSAAEGADFIWLAARTDPKAPKHKGISLFIVDTRTDGFSHAPIETVGTYRTNMTYYDNVRVHESRLVGEINQGWQLMTAQLNHERVGLAAWGIRGWKLFQRCLQWARQSRLKGGRAIDEPWVQRNLAETYARLEAMRMTNARMVWELDEGRLSPALASALKVYSTECMIEVCRLLMEVIGPASLVRAGSSTTVLRGDLEHEYRLCQINTFGGGVNEVQRGIVSNFGLGMPRHR